MIAGRTALVSLEGIQLALVDEAPLLKHKPDASVQTYYFKADEFGHGCGLKKKGAFGRPLER